MKTNYEGVTETKKSILVDVDEYTGRDRYYQGTNAGRILRFSKDVFSVKDLLEDDYNDYYDCYLDVILDQLEDIDTNVSCGGPMPKGISNYRNGYIVE